MGKLGLKPGRKNEKIVKGERSEEVL